MLNEKRNGFVVLANEAAGDTDEAAVRAVVHTLAAHGPVERLAVAADRPVDRLLAETPLDGRRLVVAGGDGTLHVVVGALWHQGLAAVTDIALVPRGTGNDFARSAGIPLDPLAAARLAATGAPRSFDLLIAEMTTTSHTGGEGRPLVNALHLGVGVAAAEAATSLKWLGPLAYRVGALVAGASAPPTRVRVTVDGEPVADGAMLVAAVGNGGTTGGGTPLVPPADPGDGWLDVVVAPDGGRWHRLRFARALRSGRHLDALALHRTGRIAELTGEGLRVNVDGELCAPVDKVRVEVAPAAWRLVAPAGAEAGVGA